MEMELTRDTFSSKDTMGVLVVPGAPRPAYQTLELPKKDYLPGSCVAPGRYQVKVVWSEHFQRPMPQLQGIPNRSLIEMHWGDFVDDTKGCILVGETRTLNYSETTDAIWSTQAAFDEVFPLINAADQSDEGCWITIREN